MFNLTPYKSILINLASRKNGDIKDKDINEFYATLQMVRKPKPLMLARLRFERIFNWIYKNNFHGSYPQVKFFLVKTQKLLKIELLETKLEPEQKINKEWFKMSEKERAMRLRYLIRRGDIEQLREIPKEIKENLNNYLVYIYPDFEYYVSLLLFAAMKNEKEIIKFLLNCGCEINKKRLRVYCKTQNGKLIRDDSMYDEYYVEFIYRVRLDIFTEQKKYRLPDIFYLIDELLETEEVIVIGKDTLSFELRNRFITCFCQWLQYRNIKPLQQLERDTGGGFSNEGYLYFSPQDRGTKSLQSPQNKKPSQSKIGKVCKIYDPSSKSKSFGKKNILSLFRRKKKPPKSKKRDPYTILEELGYTMNQCISELLQRSSNPFFVKAKTTTVVIPTKKK